MLRNPWHSSKAYSPAAGPGAAAAAAGALHTKKCLFGGSLPAPGGAGRHQHMCSNGSGSKPFYSPGAAWVKGRAAVGSRATAAVDSSNSSTQYQQIGAGRGRLWQQQQQQVGFEAECGRGVDDGRSSLDDDGASSSGSSSMVASQVEAWQQALSNSLGRALSKLQPVP